MIRIARKLDKLFGEYVKAYRQEVGQPRNFIWIAKSETGECMIHALSVEDAKKAVQEMEAVQQRKEGE